MKAYRLLTGDDSSAFCHKVTKALSEGWELHGAPTCAFNPETHKMMCAQAVVKEVDAPYHPGIKLGKL